MDHQQVKIIGNSVILFNGISQVFLYPIKKHVAYRNILVLLLDPPLGTIYNENVFAISCKGDMLWQIQEVETLQDLPEERPIVDIAFDNEKGCLVCQSWDCYKYNVEIETGKIISAEFTK